MYCSKCGKEIKDNEKFCSHCGVEYIKRINVANGLNLDFPSRNTSTKIIFNLVPLILVLVLGFLYYKNCLLYLDKNMDAFDWVSNSARTIGVIFYWGIPIIFSGVCIEYILKCISEKMNVNMLVCIKTSTNMFIYGIFLWLGHTIFSDWTSNDMSIVFYRIFSTYEELIGMTMIFALAIFVCGILIGKKTKSCIR